MISWNGAAEKYDIRDWAPEHEKMGKGKRGTEEKGRIVTKNKTITEQSERRECYGTFHCTSECDFKM